MPSREAGEADEGGEDVWKEAAHKGKGVQVPGRSSTQLIILEESQSDQLPSPPVALPSYIWCWY